MARPPLIVAYHAVSNSWSSPLAVRPAALDHQLAHLRRHGYVGLTFAESERRRQAGTLPDRSVVITFDDGYRSTLAAADILAAHGYPGTVFVVTGFVASGGVLEWPGIQADRGNPRSEEELRSLTWEELERLVDRGWEVGSHTVSHALLSEVSAQRLERELTDSKDAIATRLGSCETVSYPYGREDATVAHASQAAGYLAGCTLKGVPSADGPHLRPRVGLGSRQRGLRLRFTVSPLGLRARRTALARAASGLRARPAWLPRSGEAGDA